MIGSGLGLAQSHTHRRAEVPPLLGVRAACQCQPNLKGQLVIMIGPGLGLAQSNHVSSKLRSQRTIRHSQLRLSEKLILFVIAFY